MKTGDQGILKNLKVVGKVKKKTNQRCIFIMLHYLIIIGNHYNYDIMLIISSLQHSEQVHITRVLLYMLQ